MTENEIGMIVVDTALRVHRRLGPGLLEIVCEAILANELNQAACRCTTASSDPNRM